MIKNRRKSSKVKSAIHLHKVPRNVVLYYVKCKLEECGDKYNFVQYNSFVSKMAKEWVKEPPHVQSKYIDSLHRLQDDKISYLRLRQSLANYNKGVNPVFKTFLGWNCFSVIILEIIDKLSQLPYAEWFLSQRYTAWVFQVFTSLSIHGLMSPQLW